MDLNEDYVSLVGISNDGNVPQIYYSIAAEETTLVSDGSVVKVHGQYCSMSNLYILNTYSSSLYATMCLSVQESNFKATNCKFICQGRDSAFVYQNGEGKFYNCHFEGSFDTFSASGDSECYNSTCVVLSNNLASCWIGGGLYRKTANFINCYFACPVGSNGYWAKFDGSATDTAYFYNCSASTGIRNIYLIDGSSVPNIYFGHPVYFGYKSIVFTAEDGITPLTNGCSIPTQVEIGSGANIKNYVFRDFDASTTESIEYEGVFPKNATFTEQNYNGSTLSGRIYWTANSTSTGTVRWAIQGFCNGNDTNLDQNWGTAVEVTDANTSTPNQEHYVDFTGLTLGNTPAGGKSFRIKIYRHVEHADDNLAADARLRKVLILYKTNQPSDTGIWTD